MSLNMLPPNRKKKLFFLLHHVTHRVKQLTDKKKKRKANTLFLFVCFSFNSFSIFICHLTLHTSPTCGFWRKIKLLSGLFKIGILYFIPSIWENNTYPIKFIINLRNSFDICRKVKVPPIIILLLKIC